MIAADRLRDVFDLAAEAPDPAARAALLDRECAGDPALRERVEALLRAHNAAGSFLARPPAAVPDGTTGHAPEDGSTADLPAAGEGPGAVIGPYKLLERVGEGGFGIVYLAGQTHPVRRKVALKVLRPGMDTRQVVARFEAERQALAIMDHPNIARVFDGGTTPSGRPFFVMELVKGAPITDFCDRNHLTPRQRLELFVSVCAAVQHAHQKGIIHRDIKPSNVLVSLHDATPVVKVIDFGIAKALGQELTDKTLFTGLAQMVGTPLYMSPEQAGMSGLDADTRSDVYSLGVLLYELLTGTTPFTRERFKTAAYDEIRRIIREEEPPRPSTRLSESKDALPSVAASRQTEPAKLTRLVTGELDWIVMKALEKDRSRRYETANGLAMDVRRYLADEPVLACPPSAGYRLRKFARRNRGGLAVAALVLFFLVLVGSGAGWAVRDRSAREAEAARQQGERQAKVAGEVKSIFAGVDRLEKEQKWPEALEAARRAEAAVAGGEADPATAERVYLRLRDLVFIDRLERIRMETATLVEGKFSYAGTDRDYARAFREYGVDVDELPVETSVDRFRARPALAVALAAALDDWVLARRYHSGADVARWKRLVAVARGIDTEPLRDRLRAAWGRPAADIRDDLRRLAESNDLWAQHPATLFMLARTLNANQFPDSALRIARDAQNLHPGDYWLNHQLGDFLRDQNDHEGAIRFYTASVASRPQSAFAHNTLGSALYSQNKCEEAIAVYRRATELDPKYVGAHINLGDVLADRGDQDGAERAYREAVRLSGDRIGADKLAELLVSRGKLKEAIATYQKITILDPDNYRAWYQAAALYLYVGDVDRYRRACREMLDRFEHRAADNVKIAEQTAKTCALAPDAVSDFARVEQLARRAVTGTELQAWYRNYVLAKGLTDYRGGHPEQAVEWLTRFAPKPDGNVWDATAFAALALAQHRLGHAAEARAALVSARALLAEKPDAQTFDWLHCEILYREAEGFLGPLTPQELAAAQAALIRRQLAAAREAVRLKPDSGDALNSLAWLLATCSHAELRHPREAVTLAKKAVEFAPKQYQEWNTLGVAHYRAGDATAAVAALHQSTELRRGGNGYNWFFLAMAHWQLGEKDKAREFYDQAVQWTDTNRPRDEELRRFRAEAAELMGIDGAKK
jgi:serine/threonine protein kinase/tetratricopeptide (TPR) repeat protein